MIITIFGVSNVGKTTVGRILAEKLHYQFVDIDEETKKYYHTTLDGFMERYPEIKMRDRCRAKLTKQAIKKYDNCVIAIPPITYIEYFDAFLDNNIEVFEFELRDTPENILSRLVFSDENDQIYQDDEYVQKHRNYYLQDIISDIIYYGYVYRYVNLKVDIDGRSPEEVADLMIERHGLDK